MVHDDSCKQAIKEALDRKKEILATLRRFREDRSRTFEEKRYQCAWKLTNSQKRDLETAKAKIESQIENDRTLAAFLAFIGVVVSSWVSTWIREDLKQRIATLVTISFAALGIFFLYKTYEKACWLHILKMALPRKSVT